MKYTRKQVQQAIFVLEVEANSNFSDISSQRDVNACPLATIVRDTMPLTNHSWREVLAEAAAILRDGWLPGEEFVDLHTGDILK